MRHLKDKLSVSAIMMIASIGSAMAWGAIAVDNEAGQDPDDAGFGMVSGYSNKNEASSDALAACKEADNSDCRVVLTFQGCGAYAASSSKFGVGSGANVRQAEQRAVAACKAPGCKVVVSDCE